MMLTSTNFTQTTNYMKSTAILFQDGFDQMFTILIVATLGHLPQNEKVFLLSRMSTF